MRLCNYCRVYKIADKYTRNLGYNFVSWELGRDLLPSIENFPVPVTEPCLIFLANPKTPTGHEVPEKLLYELLISRPESDVLIDEAYFGFGTRSYIGWIDKFPNLTIMRSMSKSFLAPALRVGLVISKQERIKLLASMMPQFLMTNFSLIAAVTALKSREFAHYQAEAIATIVAERNRIISKLENLSSSKDFQVLPSNGNFVSLAFDSTETLNSYFERLRTKGIRVAKFGSDENYLNMLRFSICENSENCKFLEVFE